MSWSSKTARTALFWRFPKTTHRPQRFKTLAECNEARLAPVTGVKTVQSECGILATATPAPLRKNSGTSSASTIRKQALQHRLYESHGVREASWISLSGCHPNRVQASLRKHPIELEVQPLSRIVLRWFVCQELPRKGIRRTLDHTRAIIFGNFLARRIKMLLQILFYSLQKLFEFCS